MNGDFIYKRLTMNEWILFSLIIVVYGAKIF